MGSREMILGNSELTELKANDLKNAMRLLMFEWTGFDGHLDSTNQYLEERFVEIESREKNLSSIQQSVMESNKELESIRESIEERYKELEFKQHEFQTLREEHLNEVNLKEKKLGLIGRLMEERTIEAELREDRIGAHQKLVEGLFEKMKSEMKEFENLQKLIGGKLKEIKLKEMQMESDQKVYQECVKEFEAKENKSNRDKKLFEEKQLKLLQHSRILGLTDNILDLPRESATCINTSRKRARNSVAESSGNADIEFVVIDELVEKSKSFMAEDNRVIHLENEVKRLEEESNKCKKGFDELKKEEEKAKFEAAAVKLREADLLKQVEELKRQLSYKEGIMQSFESVFKTMFFNMNKVPEVVDSSPIWGRGSTEAVASSKVQASDPHEGPIRLYPEEQLESMTPRESNGNNDERHYEFNLCKENASSCFDNEKIYRTVDSSPKKVSEEVFHNFNRERSPGKFQPGQIWAVYMDGLPKKYAEIKKEYYPSILVQFLQPCTVMQPLCCGIFKVQAERTVHSPSSFSHLVEAKSICKKFLQIYPNKGEVWAIYRNWKADYSHSVLENCEYDIVEVLNKYNKQSTEVSPLVRVRGFKSVFRDPGGQRSNTGVLVISRAEVSRFSHQIPAFQLTVEKEGKLRGYWELDPAAVPSKI